MRLTSQFPPAKKSMETCRLVESYLFLINTVNHYKLVFADEKPLREKDIYDRVRRDPFDETTKERTISESDTTYSQQYH